MGPNKLDKQRFRSEAQRNNEPVAVTFDVEDHAVVADKAGTRISVLDVLRRRPFRSSHLIEPRFEWTLCIGVPRPEINQSRLGNYAHVGRIVVG